MSRKLISDNYNAEKLFTYCKQIFRPWEFFLEYSYIWIFFHLDKYYEFFICFRSKIPHYSREVLWLLGR